MKKTRLVKTSFIVKILNIYIMAKAPWSWERMHDIFFGHSFGRGARSNPVANYERKGEKKTAREKSIEVGNETKKGTPANDQ